MKDLQLLSGEFLTDQDISNEKNYLFKYFTSPEAKRLVIYDHYFRGVRRFHENFPDHTGIVMDKRLLKALLRQLSYIEEALMKAEHNKDIEAVAIIKSGKLEVPADNDLELGSGTDASFHPQPYNRWG